jgi:hypothetical protein
MLDWCWAYFDHLDSINCHGPLVLLDMGARVLRSRDNQRGEYIICVSATGISLCKWFLALDANKPSLLHTHTAVAINFCMRTEHYLTFPRTDAA